MKEEERRAEAAAAAEAAREEAIQRHAQVRQRARKAANNRSRKLFGF